jgi:UDP-galactopyranose mutase
LPIRFNYNDNYYANPLQGIPKNGYTEIFEKMLNHPNIEIKLNTKFNKDFSVDEFDHVYYTGPIDAFFDFKYGKLSYRTVFLKGMKRMETIKEMQLSIMLIRKSHIQECMSTSILLRGNK